MLFRSKVHQKYDYVNLEWLLYGKGEMMVSEEETSFSSSNSDYLPSLFDENLINSSKEPAIPENRKEMPLRNAENATKEIVKQEIRYIEKPARKITEIRIFFDDNISAHLQIHSLLMSTITLHMYISARAFFQAEDGIRDF